MRFRSLRASQQPFPWLEAQIDLQVRGTGEGAGNPRFVNRLRVELMLGFEVGPGSNRRREYYRAAATAAAAETGRVTFRFYLPPEVVRRDQLSGDPAFWLVSVQAGERELPLSRSHVSASLSSGDLAARFRQVVATEGAVNDGILLPQYDSPFANDYPRETPSFVRRPPR